MGDSSTILGVNLVEKLDLSLLNVSSNWLHSANDVINKISSLLFVEDLSEQSSRLLEVVVGVAVCESSSCAGHRLRSPFELGVLNGASKRVRLVVRAVSLVTIHSCRAITLIVSNSCSVGAVDRNLVKVSAKSVTMSIRVREKSSLKHLVV